MSLLQQAQAEGLCLQHPGNFGVVAQLSNEEAVKYLLNALQASQNVPFHWRYIDKPPEGQLAILYLPPPTHFPSDGIRYQESEHVYSMHVPVGRDLELEVAEVKSGFIPGSQDQSAWRTRRRFRLLKGGHPHLVLVHYTRQPNPSPILPQLANQPVRAYPLRTVAEPSTIVIGDKTGQKVFNQGAPPPGMQAQGPPPSSVVNAPVGGGGMMGGGPPPGMHGNMPFNHPAAQAAMINQQSNAMEQLERRREREREREKELAAAAARGRSGSASGRPPHLDDAGSDDEIEQISTRNLALARYKRNHDLMNEVFAQAAFGEKNKPPQPSPYSIFNKDELESKTAKLQAELESLKRKVAERQQQRGTGQDVTMDNGVLTA